VHPFFVFDRSFNFILFKDYIDDHIRAEMENMDKLEFNKTAPLESQKINWDDEPSPSEIDCEYETYIL
jgi:hypothetical protein